MKKLATLVLVAAIAILVFLSGGLSTSAAACTTTLNPVDDIQTAINAASAGDVICLNPGVYSPPVKININKTVTLQGPQAGIDPRPSEGTTRTPGDTSTEAIIDGGASSLSGIIVITADNVVLDGLEVRNGSGDLIDSEIGTPTTGTILRYNIIRDATGDEGVQLRACTDCVAEFNHVFDVAQDGVNMCCGSTGGAIQFNEVHDNSSENAAIYVYDSTNMTIQCNLVYDVFDNDGIKLGDKGGDDAALSGGTIVGNTVHDTAQDGITVYTSDVLVDSNEVYNSTSENGAIYMAFAISNVTVSNNNVHDNPLDTGKWGDPGAVMIGTDVDAATVHVNHNNITGNSPNGVTNKAAAELDAENNWWGATDGPSGAGSGSGDAVSTNVDFDPWLTEPQEIVDPCGPQVIEVDIDIKPGSDPNSINCNNNRGVIAVAILTIDDFDATTVDHTTVTFEGASETHVDPRTGEPRRHEEDVDSDGDTDLVFHFRLSDTDLTCDFEQGTLEGETFDGQAIQGTDSVRMIDRGGGRP